MAKFKIIEYGQLSNTEKKNIKGGWSCGVHSCAGYASPSCPSYGEGGPCSTWTGGSTGGGGQTSLPGPCGSLDEIVPICSTYCGAVSFAG